MQSTITRYMSLASFVSVLKDGLFIPKSTAFSDQWEGPLPLTKLTTDVQKNIKDMYDLITPWIYISCWHNSHHESYAMWEIYGKTTEAIALETSTDKLKNAYQAKFQNTLAYLESVDYVSPDRDKQISLPKGIISITKAPNKYSGSEFLPILLFHFLKHKGYEFERELRIVCLDSEFDKSKQNTKPGIYLDDLGKDFIENVRVPPNSPRWFLNIVQDVLKKYGYDIEVKSSDLNCPIPK